METVNLKLKELYPLEEERIELSELMEIHGGFDDDFDEDSCCSLQCLVAASVCVIANCIFFS